jgi:AmmeMemoRadiSam system protein B
VLFAARAAGAGTATIVARRDSGDETGDTSSVVGYAGVVIETTMSGGVVDARENS